MTHVSLISLNVVTDKQVHFNFTVENLDFESENQVLISKNYS